MPGNLENSAVATGLEKVSFHSDSKECSNYCTVALISHASKVMLKILQARLQQYVNFQMFKLNLEKEEEPEIKLPTFVGSSKKPKSSRKTSTSALLIFLPAILFPRCASSSQAFLMMYSAYKLNKLGDNIQP